MIISLFLVEDVILSKYILHPKASDSVYNSSKCTGSNCFIRLKEIRVEVWTMEKLIFKLKSWLRSGMSEQRLTGLALLNIHRNENINIDGVDNLII
ncbi:Uncharacterized protein FWK35_00008654 [Aphis craccivora]|uniref:Uncharacterized protein n=1 Tax=Aphis craccivora TaxID=307492 RepID=A0A6G0ZHQ3_APHCR|nr:Uncharacterized protein FWK35_00008654 [Aphis craccivora]